MTLIGIILLIAGIVCALYGNSLNHSVEAQLESLFSNGAANPGDVYLYPGVIAAVIGLVILAVNLSGKKK